MISPKTIGDLKSNVAFQQARHQNNFYYAQEMLRSADDDKRGPSEKLKDVQAALTGVSHSFPALTGSVPTPIELEKRIQMVQDVLAVEHLYLTEDQIRAHFFDITKGELKAGLVVPTPDDDLWGRVALGIMKEGLKEYNEVKKVGKTRDEYVELEKKLANLASGAIDRNDLWVKVNKEGELEDFATKVNLSKKKIEDHQAYLDAGFYGLSENQWWKADAANSAFHKHVIKDGAYKPVCYMRATSLPPRGAFQGRKAEDSTRRVIFKNPPWSMTQLAKLLNGATSKIITKDMAGTEPPVSLLSSVGNPFNQAIFKVLGTWYIVGAHVDAHDQLILQKVELKVDPATGTPALDANGNYVKKTTASGEVISSMLSTAEMKIAKGTDGKRVIVTDIVEKGLGKLITDCGYGASVNNAESEEIEVRIKAAADAPVYFVMDDTALLREWLLTPGFNLGQVVAPVVPPAVLLPAEQAILDAQNVIFAGVDPVPYLLAIRTAAVAGTPHAKDVALASVYAFLRANPSAYKALAEHSAKAPADPNQVAITAIKNRGEDKGAAFKNLPKDADREAFRAVIWGSVLAKFVELYPVVDAMRPGTAERNHAEENLRKELNKMTEKEEALFQPKDLEIDYTGGLDAAMQQIFIRMDKAIRDAKTSPASTLFATQRAELERASLAYYEPTKQSVSAFIGEMKKPPAISLAALNIIPMAHMKPFTVQDRAALRAIAWTEVLDVLLTELAVQVPPFDHAKLAAKVEEAVAEQRAVFGDSIGLTAGDSASMTNSDAVLSVVRSKIQYEQTLVNTPAYPAEGAFYSQTKAVTLIYNTILGRTCDDVHAAPPAKKAFEDATLTAVEQELAVRKYMGNVGEGMGFVPRADAGSSLVFEAATSGAIDYLSVGLEHFFNTYRDTPLVVNANGKALEVVQCAPPADAIPDKGYFKVVDKASRKEYTLTHKDRKEYVELRTQLQNVLKGYADTAIRQGAGLVADPDQVTPHPTDATKAAINNVDKAASDKPTLSM
ncbi:MAG: hypothetical protein ACHQAX_07630 [Gammaproteobacteria bacterium]